VRIEGDLNHSGVEPDMRKAALLLAVVVVLSGCGSLGGNTTTAANPATQTDTSPSGEQSPGSNGVGTGTVTPIGDGTGTVTPIGDSQEHELYAAHRNALDAESYILRINTSGRTESTLQEAGSAGGLPVLTTLNMSDGWQRSYYVRGEEFGVQNASGVVGFAQTSIEGGTFIPVFFQGSLGASPGNRRLAAYFTTVDYTESGTRTVDGTEYTVYEADSTDDFVSGANENARPVDRTDATGFSSTVLIDQQGIVRSYQATYEYPDGMLQVNGSVTAVGEIVVQQPRWLPEACEQTDFDAITVDCEQGLDN